ILRGELPECCKRHVIPTLRDRQQKVDCIGHVGPEQGRWT
ncbi:MAG: hypothetical protein HW394_1521, partial [Acidobacteria bacterium]|nr:hypothetical protein [Acidobacteriota bacterium]